MSLLFESFVAKGFSSEENLKRYYRIMMLRLLDIDPREYKKINSILNGTRLSDILLSSDLHFLRDLKEIEELKIKAHNSTITNNSVWICLGDIGYKYHNDPKMLFNYITQLNKGKYNILILGNHDIYGREFYHKCGFNFICKAIVWKDFVFTHVPLQDLGKGDLRINIHGHTHDMSFEDYAERHAKFNEMLPREKFYIKVWTDKYNQFRPVSLYQLLMQYYATVDKPLRL